MNAITDHITSIFLKIKEDDIQCHSEKLRFFNANHNFCYRLDLRLTFNVH